MTDPGLSERIIGCAYTVSNKPDAGFVEKVYENAPVHELRKAGLYTEPPRVDETATRLGKWGHL